MEQKLGPYRLTKPLGRGGMGEVYLAVDPRTGENVAVKTLLPEVLQDEERRRRFLREIRLLATIDRHENVVGVQEVLLRPEVDRDAVVMERLDGPSLRDVLQGGPLEVGHALRLARQMASALAHVHAHGLVHRDFKPSNVVLVDDTKRAVLLDFGIAKEIRKTEDITRLTETGQVLGTAEYMAPEQVQGSEAEPAADLFAFGVVLYQMLSGISPFRGSTPAETSANILYRHPPTVDRQQDLVPPAVGDLVDRLLAKLAADRPRNMEKVVAELDALIARPSFRPRRFGRTIPGAAAVLLVFVGLAWFGLRGPGPTPVREPPTTVRTVDQEMPALDEVGSARLQAEVRRELVRGGYAEALELADRYGEKASTPRSRALALLYRGIALHGLDRADEAARTIEEARERMDDPLLEAQALEWTGILLTARGHPRTAVLLHRRTREIYGELASQEGGEGFAALAALARMNEAMALHALGRTDEAESLLEDARRTLEKTGSLRDAARAHVNLGVIHHLSGRLDSAAELYAQGLDAASRTEDTETQALALTNLGEVETARGRFPEALDLFHRALALYLEARRPADQVYVYLQIGEAHLGRDDRAEARKAFAEAKRLATTPEDKARAEDGLARADG